MLFVTWHDIMHHLPIYMAAMLLWFNYSGARKGLVFYLIFAFIITSSVQLVGVFLVFIALIVPALMISICKMRLLTGYIISSIAMIIGLWVSALTDYPASACVILCIILGAFIAPLISKKVL